MIRSDGFLVLVVAGLFGAFGAAAVAPSFVNHDAAWYLHVAALWLDGATLYRDVVDTNPPLIIALTAVPVSIARVLQVFEPVVFKIFVFAVAGLTAAAGYPLIRRAWHGQSSRFLMTAVLVFAILPFTRGEFGQREHFAILMVLPYVLAACAYAAGRPPGLAGDALAGAVGGLGFAMKPHFVVAWIATETCLLLVRPRARSWMRPGSAAVAVTLILYAAVVALWVPQYLAVVRDSAQVYGALNVSASELFRLTEVRFAVVAVLALAIVRLDRAGRAPASLLLAASLGFLAAAMLQMKGWGYHFLPFRVLLLVFSVALVGGLADSRPAILEAIRGGRWTVHALVIAALTFWSVRYVAEARGPAAAGHVGPLIGIVNDTRAESLALLGMRTHVYPAFPVVNYTRSRWVLRHNALWFLPGLYADQLQGGEGDIPFRSPPQMPALERKFFEQIIDDLCTNPPRLLVVEPPIPQAPAGRRSIDLVNYYRQDPRFERLFTGYRPYRVVGPYEVHVRAGEASCAGNAN